MRTPGGQRRGPLAFSGPLGGPLPTHSPIKMGECPSQEPQSLTHQTSSRRQLCTCSSLFREHSPPTPDLGRRALPPHAGLSPLSSSPTTGPHVGFVPSSGPGHTSHRRRLILRGSPDCCGCLARPAPSTRPGTEHAYTEMLVNEGRWWPAEPGDRGGARQGRAPGTGPV